METKTEWGVRTEWPGGEVEISHRGCEGLADSMVKYVNLMVNRPGLRAVKLRRTVTISDWEEAS